MFDELLANEKSNFKLLYEKVLNYVDHFFCPKLKIMH